MDAGLEGAERASSDAKKARPQIPPLEAASEHSRHGVAEPRTVKTPESAPSGPVAEAPRTPKSPARQPGPESPRRAHEGARATGAAVLGPPKIERPKSEKKEQPPSLSRQESSKGAKQGREEMEGKAGGVKKGGLDQGHADYKARMAFRNSLAGALATEAKEGGAGPQPPTPKRGGDGSQAGTPKAGAAAETQRETEGTTALAETSGGAKADQVEGSAGVDGSAVAEKIEGTSGDVTGSDGGSGLAVLTAGGEVSALGIPEAGAVEKAPGSKSPGKEEEGEGTKPESTETGTERAAGSQSGGATAVGGPSGEHTPREAKTDLGGQIEGSTTAAGDVADKSGALDEASLLRLAEEVAGEIEAALYAHFGGTGNPYRQQTRMLVFNLKNNPELRSRVLAKEVAPKQLCTATSDELARKELSDWRHAKEEALSALKVLTEDPLEALRRVRKKTHKGEEDVEMDKDRMAAAIMEGDKETHQVGETEEAEGADAEMAEPGGEEIAEEPLKRQRSAEGPSRTSADVTGQKTGEASNDAKPKMSAEPAMSGSGGAIKEELVSVAPAAASDQEQSAGTEDGPAGKETKEGGLSLDEYLEACMTAGGRSDQGSEDGGDEKMGEWVASDDEEEKVEEKPKEETLVGGEEEDDKGMDDFLWEGNLMLSGRACPTIASFVGGERMQIETWPMTVEVKGRVKMADFRAFMTSPQLYKHRVVMVIGLKYLEDAHDSKNHLAIASQNYLEANRVGYAEPVANLEVYIAPPKAEGLATFLPLEGDWGESGELLAVVVKRRFPPEVPPGSEPPAQQQQRQSGGAAPQGSQPRGQPTAQAGGEDVWSPPTSPFDNAGGQKGPQAWPSKKAEQGQGGGSGPAEAAPMEQDQASMQRKRRDPRLRVFQPPASSPSPTPPQEEPAGPPGFPIPRAPATLPPPPAASPPVPQTLPPPPPVRSPDHSRSHAPPVPPNFFPGGGRPPQQGPSPPPFRGAAPARAPSPPGPRLRHEDDELPHLGSYQQGSSAEDVFRPRPPPRPPGILPPLPRGPPPAHFQPPFPYMGHTPPRAPLPPLPPGPPPPHFQQHEGRPGPAPYLPPPLPFHGPSPTLSGAPQRGPENNRGRRRRGGRNRKQGPVLGGDQMGDERVMAQWLQEEAGSDSDGGGGDHDAALGEWQPPGNEQ